MGEMGDLLVARDELGARDAHLLARLVEADRRLPHLLLQDVEAFRHLAEFVARVGLHRYDVDRGVRRVEIAAAERRHRAGRIRCSVPDVSRLAALLTSVAE